MILDGYGINDNPLGNAIMGAEKPNMDRLMRECPNTAIRTNGMDVGLPEGQMGNSEVGHTNIGAGRIVYQDFTRISKSIAEGDFFENPAFMKAIDSAISLDKPLHIMGLLSDGGVHSHDTHLYALLELARIKGVRDVFVHCFLDGRDVPPDSGKKYMEQLAAVMSEKGTGRVATIMGRYYAMDRDNMWDRVGMAYRAMVCGEGVLAEDPVQAVEDSYIRKEYDEFVKPVVITSDGVPVGKIGGGEPVIFYNFRADRAREITRAFIEKDFKGFDRGCTFSERVFVCMTQYDETFRNVQIAYYPQSLVNNFGEYISRLGYRQLRIAETQKYAHVTFFFNGGEEKMYEGEDRVLIPSPKIS
ncbi:MAG: 2,3-bisphosphoglycerate-independent phosphoglycerate mutase, partial [Eubacteriales bacterium]|nr:2,3-bisphosphoglycerate-independent phosphoglycerate mutase [Eubacteriales bacterium]